MLLSLKKRLLSRKTYHLRYVCRLKRKSFFKTHSHTFEKETKIKFTSKYFVVAQVAHSFLLTRYVDKIF